MHDLATDASKVLNGTVQKGATIPFDVVEERCGSAVLYHYRSLTGDFIDTYWHELRVRKSYHSASAAMVRSCSLTEYLNACADPNELNGRPMTADAALTLFIKGVWRDSSSFDFDQGRFEEAFAELAAFSDQDEEELLQEEEHALDATGTLIPEQDLEALRALIADLSVMAPSLLPPLVERLSPWAQRLLKVDVLNAERFDPAPWSFQTETPAVDDLEETAHDADSQSDLYPPMREMPRLEPVEWEGNGVPSVEPVAWNEGDSKVLPLFARTAEVAEPPPFDYDEPDDFSAPV